MKEPKLSREMGREVRMEGGRAYVSQFVLKELRVRKDEGALEKRVGSLMA